MAMREIFATESPAPAETAASPVLSIDRSERRQRISGYDSSVSVRCVA